ncbi:polyprenyl synthetase family protein [Nocardia brasiliensis]|uniref:polyprenyl synthetase family protein n=1 Tax=Nocardia brasiliensis TaxID=37326 RepID=UPI00245520E0|nr:polyprenyl synthetase family protein [Nocardia brasiliensis]
MTLARDAERREGATILEDARRIIEPEYRAVVRHLPAEVSHIGGYHIGWWDAAGRPTTSSGKVIRPALTLTSTAALADGTIERHKARVVAAAVSVELIHDFTQLHDDVMDGDRTRRHRMTAWAQFGVGPAILTGDMFLASALETLAQHDVAAVDILAQALRGLCEGQSADLAFEQRNSVDLDECIRMSECKTATLISASCALGAWAAHADASRATCLAAFGLHIGRAFQLVDDLLGVFGDPDSTGKPLYADLIRRKKSLPVVAALNSDTVAGRRLLQRYADTEPFAGDELARLAQLIVDAGGKQWAEVAARRSRIEAEKSLLAADPETSAAADLLTLADLILSRDH